MFKEERISVLYKLFPKIVEEGNASQPIYEAYIVLILKLIKIL